MALFVNSIPDPDARFITIGAAPTAQTGAGGQWATAWSRTGVTAQQKANLASLTEAWSAIKYTDLLSTSLAGGDIFAGDLGVSGQSAATTAVKQEIDGAEGLRFVLAEAASAVSISFSSFFANDDRTAYAEGARVRLFDAAGVLVGESFVKASSTSGLQLVQLGSTIAFQSVEISAGALRADGSFSYGGYLNSDGSFGRDIYADGAMVKHGSDFLLDAVSFQIARPLARADMLALDEDAGLLQFPSVLANDSAPGTAALSAVLLEGPAHGSLTLDANGSFSYRPDADYNGSDSFTYRAFNGKDYSDPATVELTIAAVNDAPVATADSASVAEDTSVLINVLGNDRAGPANESTQHLAVTAAHAEHGSVSINPDGQLRYVPDANYFGVDRIDYTITDDGTTRGGNAPLSANGQVQVSVTDVNDAPLAMGDTANVAEDGSVLIDVLANDSAGPANESGQQLRVTSAHAAHGTVSIGTNGQLLYVPNANYFGTDQIDYIVTDNGTTQGIAAPLSAPGQVQVSIAAVNDAPVAAGDMLATDEDSAVSGNVLSGINSGRDTDVDGDVLVVTTTGTLTTAYGASVTMGQNGDFVYDPRNAGALQALATGSSLVDGFDYTVSDGHGGTSIAHVQVTVNGVTDAKPVQPTVTPQVGADVPLTYYLNYTTAKGTSKWIEVGDLHLDVQSSGTTHMGAGGGAGKASFSDVDAAFASSDAAVELMQALVKGTHIARVNIEAYRTGPGGMDQLVQRYTLEEALVTSLQTDHDGTATSNGVAFAFAQFTQSTPKYNSSGKETGTTEVRWDVAGNVANIVMDGASLSSLAQPEALLTGSKFTPTTVMETNSELDYYVRLNGTSGWLALSDFSMGFTNPGGVQAGGIETGKPLAEDVLMGLGNSSAWAAILLDVLKGKHTELVEVEAYARGSEGPRLVDEYIFKEVLFTLHDSTGTTNNVLGMDYASFTHGHQNYDLEGRVATWTGTGYDLNTNVSVVAPVPHADVPFA
jgi:VCBS repeat-containing protein